MTNESSPAAFIIGGAGGIGSALAAQLGAAGWRLTLAGRDADKLAAAAGPLNARTAVLDARDAAAMDAAVDEAVAAFGRLDAVANCAGSFLLKPAHLTSPAEFTDTLNANLVTAFNTVRAAGRVLMRQPGGGSLVLCSSVAARRGLVNHEAIAAAQAGVEGLALAAAATYARYGVRVNCVAPGLTRTPLTRSVWQNENVAKLSAALHPLGRLGEPADVAAAIAWLLNPAQSWVTGQVIGVDGGLGHVQARG